MDHFYKVDWSGDPWSCLLYKTTKLTNLVGGSLVLVIILEKLIILTKQIGLVVSGSVQFYDQQNRPFLFSFVIAVMVSFPNWV
jgi:hypothetical protein